MIEKSHPIDKKPGKIILVCLVLLFILANALDTTASQTDNTYIPGQLIVKIKEGATLDDLHQLNRLYNVKKVDLLFETAVNAEDKLTSLKEKLSLLMKEHDHWYWQLDKDSDEYKEYLSRIEKKKKLLEERINRQEEIVAKIKLSQESALTQKGTPASLDNIYLLNVDESTDMLTMQEDYQRHNSVVYAQPNYINKVNRVVRQGQGQDDPYYSSYGSWGQDYYDLWGLREDKLDCKAAWQIAQGEGVVVAVIDTGVDYNHEDIWDNIWVNPEVVEDVNDDGAINLKDLDLNSNHSIDSGELIDYSLGWNFTSDNNNPMDKYGHGTHVAGTIAAVGNNGIGIVGVAPKAKIMIIKGLSDAGEGTDADLANSIKFAADYGADVLSNSWGPTGREPGNPLFEDIIAYAYERGCAIVFAAGNNSDDVSFFPPANSPKTIAVAATSHRDTIADFSNWGALIDVSAPGGEDVTNDDTFSFCSILSLNARKGNNVIVNGKPALALNNDYLRLAGTSMACPHVSGLAALIISYNQTQYHRQTSPERMRQILKLSADPIKDPFGKGQDWGFPNAMVGAGRINARRALELSGIEGLPEVKINSPQRFTNAAGNTNLAFEAMVSGNGINQQSLKVEYSYYSKTDLTAARDAPGSWKRIDNFLSEDVAGGLKISGTIDTSSIANGWLTLRVSASSPLGTGYDVTLVKFDYLDLFKITAPDFQKYGYTEDLFLGNKGDLVITWQIPDINYRLLGAEVELKVLVKDVNDASFEAIELGSVVNPTHGTWSVNFPTAGFKDGFYEIYFEKSLTKDEKTEKREETFSSLVGPSLRPDYYHLNNADIYSPLYGAVFGQADTGPLEIKGYSLLPVDRVEVGVGMSPAEWRALPLVINKRDGLFEFNGTLDIQSLDLSRETLINIRLINNFQGQEIENDRTALIFDPSIKPGWPKRLEGYHGTHLFAMGDVNGDGKDDIVVVTQDQRYLWTVKEAEKDNYLQSRSLCYLYQNQGELNQRCLANSQALLYKDTEEVLGQKMFNLGLADLDSIAGKEIVLSLYKSMGSLFAKTEILAFTMNGDYPQGWNRAVDKEFNKSYVQNMALADVNNDAHSEIFVSRLIGSPIVPEDRKISLIDHSGQERAVKHFSDLLSYVLNTNSFGTGVCFGDIKKQGSSEILMNVRNLVAMEGETKLAEPREHLFLLDADSLEVITEITASSKFSLCANPVAGNIDTDPELEIIFVGDIQEQNHYAIYAYNPDGSIVTNWPYIPGAEGERDWQINNNFTLIDIDKDAKLEVLVEEKWYDKEKKLTHLRLNLISPSGKPMPGWPVEILSDDSINLSGAVILDIDHDGAMEFIAPGIMKSRSLYKDGLGGKDFGAGASCVSPIYFFESDGRITQIKYLPGQGSLAVGNIDDEHSTELAASYSYNDINLTAEHQPGIYSEVVVFDLNSQYLPSDIHWNQYLANAQRTNIYEKQNRPPKFNLLPAHQNIPADEQFSYYIYAQDPEGDALSYEAQLSDGGPLDGMGINFKTLLLGDFDNDNDVDDIDLGIFQDSSGSRRQDLKYNPLCDLDNDGDVDALDYVILSNQNAVSSGSKRYRAGLLQWKPSAGQGGRGYDIIFSVTDNNSAPVRAMSNITVREPVVPLTVRITSPQDGSELGSQTYIRVYAMPRNDITKVEFYINQKLQYTDTRYPYNYSWHTDNLPAGTYLVKVTAYNKAGVSVSSQISLRKVTFIRGDINGDKTIDIRDILSLLQYLFLGGEAPRELGSADVNNNGVVNITDVTYLLRLVYGVN